MAYLNKTQLEHLGFKKLGENVKISDKASIYNAEMIELGDHTRVDDFCIVSGRVVIGKYCHITPMCLLAGGAPGIFLSDFCTFAYGVKAFAQSDDYLGLTLTNSLIPKKYKNEVLKKVSIGRHAIIGAASVILPGVDIAEGCSFGAMTLINKSTSPWGIYVGAPARRLKDRKKDMLDLEKKFLLEIANDPV